MIRYYLNNRGYTPIDSPQPGCWIDVTTPDADELHVLTDRYHVPAQFIDYLGDDDERPRTEREGDWTLTIIRIPIHTSRRDAADATSPYVTVPIGVIARGDTLITLCFHRNTVTTDFVQHSRRRLITVASTSDFVLRLIYAAAHWYLAYLQVINRAVTDSQQAFAASVRNDDLMHAMRLQQALVYFNTSIKGNQTLLERLPKAYPDAPVDADLLEDVDIEMRQAESTVNIYSDILAGMLDTLASIISNNVNSIMKRMTSLSLVLMVPTLIASLYGMNVHIGLSDTPHAFLIIIGVSTLLTIGVYLWLKHIRWF